MLVEIIMTNRSKLTEALPAGVEDALKRLGRNIRTARLRRKLRMEDVADRVGISRFTVADLEKGKPSTSIAAYAGALWAFGLVDQMSELADPERDEEGKVLESAGSPRQAPRRRTLDNDF